MLNADMVKVLLDGGISPWIRNNYAQDALSIAQERAIYYSGQYHFAQKQAWRNPYGVDTLWGKEKMDAIQRIEIMFNAIRERDSLGGFQGSFQSHTKDCWLNS
jgi:hypothetical protein